MIIIPGSVYGFHRPDLEIIGTGGGGSGDNGDISNNPNSKLKDKFFYIYFIDEQGSNSRINIYSTDNPDSPDWHKTVLDYSYFPSFLEDNLTKLPKLSNIVYNKNDDSLLFTVSTEYSKHIYAVKTFDLETFNVFSIYEYDTIFGGSTIESVPSDLSYNSIIDKYILLVNHNESKSIIFDNNGYINHFVLKSLNPELKNYYKTSPFGEYFILGAYSDVYTNESSISIRDKGYATLSLNNMSLNLYYTNEINDAYNISNLFVNEKDNLILLSANGAYPNKHFLYTKGINNNFTVVANKDLPFLPNWVIKYNKSYLMGFSRTALYPLYSTKDFNTFENMDFNLLSVQNNNLTIRKSDKLCFVPDYYYGANAGSYDIGIFPNMTKSLKITNFEPTITSSRSIPTFNMHYDEQ